MKKVVALDGKRATRKIDRKILAAMILAAIVAIYVLVNHQFNPRVAPDSCTDSGPAMAVVNGQLTQVKDIFSCQDAGTVKITLENGKVVTAGKQ